MSTTSGCIRELRYRIFESAVLQERVAAEAGMDAGLFSRILSGRRPASPDFVQKASAALDRLESAEAAADEARARVLAEGEQGTAMPPA